MRGQIARDTDHTRSNLDPWVLSMDPVGCVFWLAVYFFYFPYCVLPHITMQVIASVEKYENAGMKFSTVPAFALAESRASDACCLFLVQKHTREVSLFSSPGKFRPSSGINCRRGDAQPRPTSCDPCRSRAQPAGRRPCSLAVMRAS